MDRAGAFPLVARDSQVGYCETGEPLDVGFGEFSGFSPLRGVIDEPEVAGSISSGQNTGINSTRIERSLLQFLLACLWPDAGSPVPIDPVDVLP